MNAVKIDVVVPEDRELHVTLPQEVPAGRAQVIILPQKSQDTPTDVEALLRHGQEWRSKHPDRLRSKEDIDREIAEERASWGDDE